MPYALPGRPRIYYELRGTGVPLLMLAGLGRSLASWGDIAEALEDHHRLVLVDMRGVGRSDAVRRPYGVRDMMRDALRVLDHAGIERAHVFGISLGGMVAQWLAIENAPRVDRLVLAATTAGGHAFVWSALRDHYRAVLMATAASNERASAVEAELLLSESFRAAHPEVLERWAELRKSHGPSRYAMGLQLVAAVNHCAEEELTRITAPTLVVSSDGDRLVPPDNARLLARRIAGAELAWLPGTSHDLATEHGPRLAELMAAFLRER
jgi:pimeloyl-ACP methyl ester carboxylesterase